MIEFELQQQRLVECNQLDQQALKFDCYDPLAYMDIKANLNEE